MCGVFAQARSYQIYSVSKQSLCLKINYLLLWLEDELPGVTVA